MITFDSTQHKYFNGSDEYISVTTLLKKYNLSPDYGNIDKKVLEKAAKRGTHIHKLLEDYVKTGLNTEPSILSLFVQYFNNRQVDLTKATAEELVYDTKYKIAGTIDVQYQDGDDFIIADYKTTSTIHYDSVTWQLSIYNYIKNQGDIISYYIQHIKVFHYYNGILNIKELPLIPFEEVEKLLEANLINAPYTYKPDYSKVLTTSEFNIYEQILNDLNEYTQIVKDLETKKKSFDNRIKDNMEAQKLNTIYTDNYKINLIQRKGASTYDTTKVTNYLKSQGEIPENFKKQGNPSTSLLVTKLNNDTVNGITTLQEDLESIKLKKA